MACDLIKHTCVNTPKDRVCSLAVISFQLILLICYLVFELLFYWICSEPSVAWDSYRDVLLGLCLLPDWGSEVNTILPLFLPAFLSFSPSVYCGILHSFCAFSFHLTMLKVSTYVLLTCYLLRYSVNGFSMSLSQFVGPIFFSLPNARLLSLHLVLAWWGCRN